MIELMRKFATDCQKAGGEVELELYEGANHGFMTGKPDAPYASRAIDRNQSFHPQTHPRLTSAPLAPLLLVWV
jgi:acetyl esterase/lipase